MRIYVLLSFSCLMCMDLFAQKPIQQNDSFVFKAKPDSIIQCSKYGFIYSTTDTSSILYQYIVPKPNDIMVNIIYADFIQHIKKEYNQKIRSHELKDFPKKWHTVHNYNNNFYLYAPSDWMVNSGYYVSDSIIYITKSDPYDLYVIMEIYTKKDGLKRFKIINYFGEYKIIQVEPVDSKYGIFNWTFFNAQNEIENQYLMQDSRFAKTLPMIVCDCGNEKCILEFKFDETKLKK